MKVVAYLPFKDTNALYWFGMGRARGMQSAAFRGALTLQCSRPRVRRRRKYLVRCSLGTISTPASTGFINSVRLIYICNRGVISIIEVEEASGC